MSGNERNEQSVLISLDSLSAESPNQDGHARDGESGLLDIGALESAGLVAREGGDAAAPASPAFTPASAIQVAAPRSFSPALVAAMVVGALALVGGGVFVGMNVLGGDDTPTEAVAANATPKAQPDSAAPAPKKPETSTTESVAAKPPTQPETAPASAPEANPAEAAKPEVTAKAKTKLPARKPSRARTRKKPVKANPSTKVAAAEPAKPAPAAAKPKPKPKADEVDNMLDVLNGKKASGGAVANPTGEAVDPLLPKKLSRQQIIGVVRRNARAVRTCKAQEPKTGGTVMVEMLIQGTGSVKSAKVVSAQKGTPMGNCVERKVKVFRFAQFNGPPMRIKMPFAL